MRDLYDVLGVPRGADKAQIKKSFKALARRYHPDVSEEPDAEERFKEVNAAYAVLSDDKRRALYDEFGEVSLQQGFDPERFRGMGGGPGPGMGGISLDDLLGSLFGSGAFRGADFRGFDPQGGFYRRVSLKGRDVRAQVSVDLPTAVRGGELPVSIETPEGRRQLVVRIPPGVRDGQSMRLRGQGEAAPPGGRPGDVLLEITVREPPGLRREGDDLVMELPLTFAESLAGASVEVPTPSGPVVVKIPPGARSGAKLRLRGKGAPRRGGSAGDLYLVLRPTPPAAEVDGELVAQLEALYDEDVRSKLDFFPPPA